MFCTPYHLLVQNQNLQLLWCTCKKPNDIGKGGTTYVIHSHHHDTHISHIRITFYLQRVEDTSYKFMLISLTISTASEWLKIYSSLAKNGWMAGYIPHLPISLHDMILLFIVRVLYSAYRQLLQILQQCCTMFKKVSIITIRAHQQVKCKPSSSYLLLP